MRQINPLTNVKTQTHIRLSWALNIAENPSLFKNKSDSPFVQSKHRLCPGKLNGIFLLKMNILKKEKKRNEIGFKNAGLIKKQLDLKQM